ncbi:heme oxygenase [Gordonia hirsuta DSM 44140 = NBRC 16056]|uniref:Heme oxygenase n=1 Tax=Gordonia hirsuta DSM 44140 = NBRC 16056 TaxID=1121927 RepID=L7LBN6_9ACTN|nr:biliverdin-producing heme oxygenase [Gordonia hirsuta]GAC57457.1 heme oxygenase [Gordonia hirsuta DSM 44140 = NBRC 16056]
MTTTTLDPADLAEMTLSVAMKVGSAVEHDEAEHSAFMDELLGGRVNEAGYIAYLKALRPVYATLETLGRELTDDPVAAPVIDAGLERLAAIDADLDYWAPGESHETDSPAANAYAATIAASAGWGGLYLAHHYTRYLGDLSGGQAVGAILNRAFELDGKGLAFYDFAEIGKNKPYKDVYREKLDAIGAELSAEDRLRIIEEVRKAFLANHTLFAELGRDLDKYRR